MNEKEIIVITNSPMNDICYFKEYLNEIIEQIYSNKVVLKDGTILKFHSNKNMVGIHNYYYFHEIFEHFLRAKNKQLQQENKQLKDNWNKLKEFIVKEYYMYLPLEANTKYITILLYKIAELEKESENGG